MSQKNFTHAWLDATEEFYTDVPGCHRGILHKRVWRLMKSCTRACLEVTEKSYTRCLEVVEESYTDVPGCHRRMLQRAWKSQRYTIHRSYTDRVLFSQRPYRFHCGCESNKKETAAHKS